MPTDNPGSTPASGSTAPVPATSAPATAGRKRPATKGAKGAPRAKAAVPKASVPEPSGTGVPGTIVFFDPSTGRGAVESNQIKGEIVVDVAKTTRILNQSYVRLDAGRDVTVWVENGQATALRAVEGK